MNNSKFSQTPKPNLTSLGAEASDSDLDAVAGLSTTGIVVRTGTGTATTRAITGTSTEITVTNGDGVSGAPTLSLSATATNDSAASGKRGEYLETVVLSGAAVSLTTNTAANVITLSLTAGDWDVSGELWCAAAGTTVTTLAIGEITTTSATLTAIPNAARSTTSEPIPNVAGNSPILALKPCRISIAGTTNVYLVAYITFTVSTMVGHGILRARRMR